MAAKPAYHEVKDYPAPIQKERVCLSFGRQRFVELSQKVKNYYKKDIK